MSRSVKFLIVLLIVAFCLRSSITGVGPLLGQLRTDMGLSATAAGLLSSLPLLMFAVCAPMARLARSHGTERMLLAALLALLAGILVRPTGPLAALYGGTILLAGGIAVANILLPVLVKQHFPTRIPAITTGYASVMGLSATVGSALAAPLALALPGGWRASLLSWAAPVVIAIVLWIPHTRHDVHTIPAADEPPPPLPWKSSLAWQITGYMGLQSLVFYVTVAWYPTMLHDQGMSVASVSWMLTVYQAAALISGLAVPRLIHRLPDQRALAASIGLLNALGSLGMWLWPSGIALWMVVLGVGSGPALILALSFMGLRAANPRSVAALSLMGQALGYLVAAVGPVVFGFLHDVTGAWNAPMAFLVVAGGLLAACGYGAGRPIRQ
jgi:CP family cyanate transporter-like MFS transporter